MKAFVFTQYHHIEAMEYDIPVFAEGEALIKVSHCGINQMDVDTYLSREPQVIPPRILGNEICGTVIKINSTETLINLEGARVTIDPVITCGKCSECTEGRSNHCENLEIIGFTRDGGFAEYVTAPIKNMHLLPDIEDIECFTLACSLASAFHIDSIINPDREKYCVIFGSGPLEIMCGLVLGRDNRIKIDIVDDNSFRLNIAQSFGLSTIYLHSANINSILNEYFYEQNKSVDTAIIGFSRVKNALSLGIELVHAGGKIILTRNIQSTEGFTLEQVIEKELIFAGINLYTKNNFQRSINEIANNISVYTPLITHRLPLNGVSNGLQILETVSESMKVVIMI